jgi:hypothetical protein
VLPEAPILATAARSAQAFRLNPAA